MNFNGYGGRCAKRAGAALAATLLMSCGGGEQVQTFSAQRILSFGDESSLITNSGLKYSVNAVFSDSGTVDCTSNPLWIQSLATRYGLVFPQCNPNGVISPASRIYAAPNATVADLSAQIDQQVNDGGFVGTDLATILIGQRDILDQYAQYPGIGQAELEANLTQLGIALATQVNRIADIGGKVLISTVADLGLTPFGIDEELTSPGRQAVLSALTLAFNTAVRANIENDGRKIGLVLLDERIQLLSKAPSAFALTNVSDPACSAALPNCSSLTLVPDESSTNGSASATGWLWADTTHLSAGGQANLATLALQRAVNNPF